MEKFEFKIYLALLFSCKIHVYTVSKFNCKSEIKYLRKKELRVSKIKGDRVYEMFVDKFSISHFNVIYNHTRYIVTELVNEILYSNDVY